MRARWDDQGFTLIEVTIAMIMVMVGVLALAGGIALGARQITGSQDQLLASERAAEAAETVFKARDSRVLTWAQIKNVNGASGADGGVFLDGPQPIKDPGNDGLINTADDGALVTLVKPGPDGVLGTADDISVPYLRVHARDRNPRHQPDAATNPRHRAVPHVHGARYLHPDDLSVLLCVRHTTPALHSPRRSSRWR